jgi:hypothetical protein
MTVDAGGHGPGVFPDSVGRADEDRLPDDKLPEDRLLDDRLLEDWPCPARKQGFGV